MIFDQLTPKTIGVFFWNSLYDSWFSRYAAETTFSINVLILKTVTLTFDPPTRTNKGLLLKQTNHSMKYKVSTINGSQTIERKRSVTANERTAYVLDNNNNVIMSPQVCVGVCACACVCVCGGGDNKIEKHFKFCKNRTWI